jgi:hypothetical protein
MLVVCSAFPHANNDDHGGRWGDTARALAQWQCLVASFEATDALHWVMIIVLYRPGSMVIEITVKFVTFFTL